MWPNPQFPADVVTYTGEILNGKLHFLCSVSKFPVINYFSNHGVHPHLGLTFLIESRSIRTSNDYLEYISFIESFGSALWCIPQS